MEPYVRQGESDEWYVRFGRGATIAGLVVAMGTALIASTYDNLMNYVQALFSIFNAPLFGAFIIGMFWKRMTPWAGFWGLVAGTLVAGGTWIGYKAGWLSFGSDLDESMWGAGLAFVAVSVVAVAVTFMTTSKPREELQGLVYGMANVEEHVSKEDQAWYRQPWLLAVGALGLTVLVSLFFI
jgi:SSS family solute:Na+ symporter